MYGIANAATEINKVIDQNNIYNLIVTTKTNISCSIQETSTTEQQQVESLYGMKKEGILKYYNRGVIH